MPQPTINVTYNPSATPPTLTCNPTSITVAKGTSANIAVNLLLSAGSTGSIVFSNPPFNWTPDPGFVVAPPNGGTSQEVITDPNLSKATYVFTVNYTYTPQGGTPVSGTGDPTIVNEGTGSDGDGE